jgi:kynureninase
MFSSADDSLEAAKRFDEEDPLQGLREKFHFPKNEDGSDKLYFCGHSLGLMPKQSADYVNEVLNSWAKHGVEGHTQGKWPWLPYHEFITNSFAKLLGAKPAEVVAMNTLTVNLHLMLVSFYTPKQTRYKILIENNTFPSDKYAVDSQARFHGFDPKDAIVELRPRPREKAVRDEDVLQQIEDLGDSLALIMLGNCNYLSGQNFDMQAITKQGHKVGAKVGFNLAHGAGNIEMHLHDWNVDFAVWCSYKYLNSGPGGIAGAFVHEAHLGKKDISRFEGWWGQDKQSRFKMGPDFMPIPTAEAWQLSNPPILALASLRSTMQIFDEVGMPALTKKSRHITAYLRFLLSKKAGKFIKIETPESHGSMLCIQVQTDPKVFMNKLQKAGIVADFREPDIFRLTPAPLYNSYEDVYHLSEVFNENRK